MQIFVDADACPVIGIVEKVAKEHSVPVTLLCDTNRVGCGFECAGIKMQA